MGPVTVEGRVPPPGDKFINADTRMVSGDYFQAMEIPLIEGRLFKDHDVPANPAVAIVDDYMAQQLWPGQDAVGKRFHIGGIDDTSAPWITVVGVVGRVKQYTLDSGSRIAFYLPHTQYPVRAMNVVVRSSADQAALTGAVKQQLHELNTDLPLYNVVSMEQRVQLSLARRRFAMLLLAGFAGISLALTGVAMGVAAALLLTRLMQSLLFGVTAGDPLTFCAVPLLLLFIALLATSVPARRAAQVDPAECLRYD